VLEHRYGDFGDTQSLCFSGRMRILQIRRRHTAPGLSNQGADSVFCHADRPSNGKAVRGNARIVAHMRVTRLQQVPDCHRAGCNDACRDRRIGRTASQMLAFGNPGWADGVGCSRLVESNGKPWDGSRFAWDSVGTRGAPAGVRQRARLILSSGKE
jgi:hypothetical protein